MATVSDMVHEKGEIDLLDYMGVPIFGLAAVTLVGIGTFTLFGVGFTDPFYSWSGYTLTWAGALALGFLGMAWVTNRAGQSWDDLEAEEQAVAGAGVLLIVGLEFVPAVENTIVGSDIAGLAAFIALSASYTVLAYY